MVGEGGKRRDGGARPEAGVPIRAVVFDLFDTLVDLSWETLPKVEFRGRQIPSTAAALHAAVAERAEIGFDAFTRVLFEVDAEFRESHYAADIELSTPDRFRALVERLELDAPELPAVLTAVHMGMIRERTEVPAHHAEVLGALHRRARLGICSNFSHAETAHQIIDAAGFRPHLDAVVISDEVGLRKPRGEIFEAVLGGLDAAPAETLHVGDSLDSDVGGAAAAGMRTAWVTRRVSDPERRLCEHDGPKPDWSIGDIAELPRLLAR